MRIHPFWFLLYLFLGLVTCTAQEITSGKADLSAINVLLIDGQGTHNWRETTPILKKDLEETGLFDVMVSTTPEEDADISEFKPDFTGVDVVLLNYCGKTWSSEARQALLQFIANGGGLVLYHSANTTFPDWPEFQLLLGMTGWGGRNAEFGPYRFWDSERNGTAQLLKEGPTGTIGAQMEILIQNCAPTHPIMKGIPPKMLHCPDEVYAHLRGKASNAQNVMVLAAALSDEETGGSGRLEPLMAAVLYGKGRVFQILYGHNGKSCRSVAFIVPFIRGTQWAATGTVTIPVPEDVPSEEKTYSRGM